MATANMVLLEKISVGAAGASSVTFSNIPQTGYTDLVMKMSVRTAGGSPYDFPAVKFNGSSSGYTDKVIYGNGSFATSEQNNSTTYAFGYFVDANGATANTFGSSEWYIPNYTSANYKSISQDVVSENNSASQSYTSLAANLWSNTAAITSIAITPANGASFVQYSTFYLYGVAKLGTTPAIQPYATGGDTIMTDGTYWYHTFVSSGTFTPAKALSCDYLVVAGGGGGGALDGGGGGGGGMRSTVTATGGGGSLESKLSLGTSAYTVTIGAGGAGAPASSGAAANGSNSVFSTITSIGGGAGGGRADAATGGSTGGSGGGGGYDNSLYSGGAGTANQGYAGGNGLLPGGYASGGGGGGAGAVGANAVTGASGNGGTGVATLISGSSVTYAGGGGGGGDTRGSTAGTGGSGGGGAGSRTTTATAGTVNLGGGGGGGGYNGSSQAGGSGGSGIVIVRYAI
jgi:hypothetical protein